MYHHQYQCTQKGFVNCTVFIPFQVTQKGGWMWWDRDLGPHPGRDGPGWARTTYWEGATEVGGRSNNGLTTFWGGGTRGLGECFLFFLCMASLGGHFVYSILSTIECIISHPLEHWTMMVSSWWKPFSKIVISHDRLLQVMGHTQSIYVRFMTAWLAKNANRAASTPLGTRWHCYTFQSREKQRQQHPSKQGWPSDITKKNAWKNDPWSKPGLYNTIIYIIYNTNII